MKLRTVKFKLQVSLASIVLMITSIQQCSVAAQANMNLPFPVTGLHLVTLDAHLGLLTLSWNSASKGRNNVDKYAIYYMPASYGDPPSGVEWGISSRNSIKISFKNASLIKFSEIDKFLAFDPGDGIFFWVLAHNKYGWGKNDIRTENPNETFQNYLKRLSIQGRNPPNFTFIDLDYLLVSRSK